MVSLTISEKIKIKPSRRQHKENERDCRKIVQQLVSSIPQNVLTSTSYKRKKTVERDIEENRHGHRRKPISKAKRLNKTWGKKVCPGSSSMMGTGEFINKTRDKKVCPRSQV